ncbi:MAG: hypothetical protein Q4B31_04925 [Clostridia bacterium]|nr:hypothetical protein [Clostridia bacterium]
MARAGRQKSEKGVYHVLLRGVDKLFFEEADYIEFKSRLSEYFSGDVKLLAFLLLSNRVHLMVLEDGGNMSLALKPLLTSYARYINRTYSAEGKLFYDRYKSVPLDTNADIADTVQFFHAIGNRFTTPDKYSFSEYTNEEKFCDTKKLKALAGESVLSLSPKALHLDDYTQLTRAEMGVYLKIVADSTLEEVALMDRQSETFKRIFSGGVTARAVLPLFDIHAKAKTAEKKEEKQKSKENLSVWLL